MSLAFPALALVYDLQGVGAVPSGSLRDPQLLRVFFWGADNFQGSGPMQRKPISLSQLGI